MKRVINLITDNFGLKILAVIFAVILWMVVVNIDDPDMTKQFTVPVTIENGNVITDMGKVYQVLDDSDMAVFTVTASRSVVEDLTSSDFRATADMSQIEGMSLVPIEITAQKYTSRITITKKTQNVKVSVEDLKSSQFVINVDSQGTPAEGCAVGKVEVTPNVLTVTGAESVVSSIAKVVAVINVNGMSSDITDRVIPVLYDADGRVISADNLTFNQETVTVSASIENKKEIPVQFETSGEPAEGYVCKSVICSPETVVVQGEASALNSISSVKIPGEVLDMSGARESFSNTVDLREYLPEGITLCDETEVVVAFTIEPLATRSFTIPVENITIRNLSEDMEPSFSSDTVQIRLSGLDSDLDAVNVSEITGVVDVADGVEGMNTFVVAVENLPDGVSLAANVNIRINLTRKDSGQEDSRPIGSTAPDNQPPSEGDTPQDGDNTDDSGEGSDSDERE